MPQSPDKELFTLEAGHISAFHSGRSYLCLSPDCLEYYVQGCLCLSGLPSQALGAMQTAHLLQRGVPPGILSYCFCMCSLNMEWEGDRNIFVYLAMRLIDYHDYLLRAQARFGIS